MLVLMDRDGVLNEERADFVKSPAELQMLPGAASAVARLNEAGHIVAMVTNQSVVGRGLIDEAMLARIHDALREALASAGARLDLLLVCTDPPWAGGPRRKPAPGMLREAMQRFQAAPAETVMIGDSLRDLEAAAAVGAKRILVRTGKGALTQAQGLPAKILPVSVYNDLAEAATALTAPSGEATSTMGQPRR
jgi:D-glycero-D-manno-heptose 1,7-bisphosphate phosphatase